jgi:hypothetical protein
MNSGVSWVVPPCSIETTRRFLYPQSFLPDLSFQPEEWPIVFVWNLDITPKPHSAWHTPLHWKFRKQSSLVSCLFLLVSRLVYYLAPKMEAVSSVETSDSLLWKQGVLGMGFVSSVGNTTRRLNWKDIKWLNVLCGCRTDVVQLQNGFNFLSEMSPTTGTVNVT